MLWAIRAQMKPALAVIEMIPNVHRTPALAALRKAALAGGTPRLRLSPDDKDLAFYDGPVQLVSPIGARLLLALYHDGLIKLKKPATAKLPALETYIATEPAFRAHVAQAMAEDAARRARLAEIIADPACARPDDLTPALIDKVMTARAGHGVYGSIQIGGILCHKTLILPPVDENAQTRAEGRVLCWWLDDTGQRQGDRE